MIALQLFVKKTKLGKAMRAVPQDKDASTLVGINVNKIITTTFAIGSGLAAVAALMYCATYPRVTNDMGSMMGMKASSQPSSAASASSPARCWAVSSSVD